MENFSREYDQLIVEHYSREADKHGLNPTSTMPDRMIREKETFAIIRFVEETIQTFVDFRMDRKLRIMDVGCGNGYTLGRLSTLFPSQEFIGVEKSKKMLQLARSRFEDATNVTIVENDIREAGFVAENSVDIVISQRILINILNLEDQKTALRNIIKILANRNQFHPGGRLISIESFKQPLDNLNTARLELDLPPIAPKYHNLYLDDTFFNVPSLVRLTSSNPALASNFLSTNYFIARVLHPLLKKDKSISRNSELVNFFVSALRENVGDYAPLKTNMFAKVQ